MGNIKSILIGLTTFLGATALTTGGIALNNHFNKDKPITLSYGDKTFFGETTDSDATDITNDEAQDIEINKNIEELNTLCQKNKFMILTAIDLEYPSMSVIRTVNNASEIENVLNETWIQQNIEGDSYRKWKGWSTDIEGKEIISNYASLFEYKVVFVYAQSESVIPYQISALGVNYQYQANADGKIESIPNMSSIAPEGYSFLGFSTVSDTDTENIIDLASIIIEANTTYYAVFVDEEGNAYNFAEHSIKVSLNYLQNMSIVNTDISYYDGNFTNEINVQHEFPNNDGTTIYFVGWYTDSTVSDTVDPDKYIENLMDYQPSENIELYALYQVAEDTFLTVNQLSIIKFTWTDGESTWMTSYISSANDLSLATEFAKTFTPNEIPENKTFIGWTTVEDSLENIVDFNSTSVIANTTYYGILQDISIK